MNKDEGGGIFYDATASLTGAIQLAEIIQRHEPSHEVSVEAENWPGLSWWKYHFHRITGTHEGFGVNFKNKHGLSIQEIKTVWTESVK
ncbi:MAG: hypothetical protein Q8O37_12045 [Sulfuricellaceae bacterium]|nr:hypothetical protein [Sulfuricellaceae bacterium]